MTARASRKYLVRVIGYDPVVVFAKSRSSAKYIAGKMLCEARGKPKDYAMYVAWRLVTSAVLYKEDPLT